MKDKLIKYGYYLMILIIVVIGTYILINWLIPLFFSCLIVLILQPLLAKEIEMLKVKNSFIAKGIIIFSVVQIYKVLEILPDYLYRLYNLFSQNHYIIDATKYLDIIYSSSMSVVESVSSEFITGLITVVMKIPSILFDLVLLHLCLCC